MPARLVALDEGSDIVLDRSMVVVGRHPLCDVRLDSLRISRHHCCMTQVQDEVDVRDLGSTNGIRINGERVERGRLRTGDELSIAHIRYRLENGVAQEMTLADPGPGVLNGSHLPGPARPSAVGAVAGGGMGLGVGGGGPEAGMLDKPLAEVVRNALGGVPEKCRIQVIVQMRNEDEAGSGSS